MTDSYNENNDNPKKVKGLNIIVTYYDDLKKITWNFQKKDFKEVAQYIDSTLYEYGIIIKDCTINKISIEPTKIINFLPEEENIELSYCINNKELYSISKLENIYFVSEWLPDSWYNQANRINQ